MHRREQSYIRTAVKALAVQNYPIKIILEDQVAYDRYAERPRAIKPFQIRALKVNINLRNFILIDPPKHPPLVRSHLEFNKEILLLPKGTNHKVMRVNFLEIR
jgi:hypothetical protein